MEIGLVLRSQTFIHLSGSGRGGAWHIGLALPGHAASRQQRCRQRAAGRTGNQTHAWHDSR